MKIAIANNNSIEQEVLKRLVSNYPEHQIAWIVKNGQDAINQTKKNPADIILMDLSMPKIDGVQATKQIMSSSPCPIIIVTSTREKNKSKAYEAMGSGAIDVIRTPSFSPSGSIHNGSPLMEKINRIASIKNQVKGSNNNIPPIVAIGSSTGGPHALLGILSGLPKSFPAAIVIIQHLAPLFSKGLASWLNKETSLTINIAKSKTFLKPSNVYIASTNDHLYLNPLGHLDYCTSPEDTIYQPSIDIFFHSLAQNHPKPGVAIILTGMGQDGANGMLMLKNKGWHTIAQDQDSSTVFNMPQAAINQNAAQEILPLNKIAPSLTNHYNQSEYKMTPH